MNQVTAMAYDDQGNLTSIDGPLTGAAGTTTRTFDTSGNVLTETDAAGRTVTRTFDVAQYCRSCRAQST